MECPSLHPEPCAGHTAERDRSAGPRKKSTRCPRGARPRIRGPWRVPWVVDWLPAERKRLVSAEVPAFDMFYTPWWKEECGCSKSNAETGQRTIAECPPRNEGETVPGAHIAPEDCSTSLSSRSLDKESAGCVRVRPLRSPWLVDIQGEFQPQRHVESALGKVKAPDQPGAENPFPAVGEKRWSPKRMLRLQRERQAAVFLVHQTGNLLRPQG